MTDAERENFLAGLGLSPDAATLTADVQPQAKAKKPKKAKEVTVEGGLDPHTMPVSDIVFDPALVNDFLLDRTDMAQASRVLFDLYKSPTKGERNKFLHRRITEFLAQVKRDRNPQPRDGFIQGKVKASKDDRDLAQMIAQAGITPDDLAVMLQALAASKQS